MAADLHERADGADFFDANLLAPTARWMISADPLHKQRGTLRKLWRFPAILAILPLHMGARYGNGTD